MKINKKFKTSLRIPLQAVGLMWLVMLNSWIMDINLVSAGLYPRSLNGLIGIITAPFIHSSLEHLSSNSFPLIFLGTMSFYFYPRISKRVILILVFLVGILVWLFARPSYHIGASGIVYGLASFIFFSGVFRKDIRSYALSFIILFLYGGIVEGLMPNQFGVSWESHLAGAVSGIVLAFIYRNTDRPKPEVELYTAEEDNEFEYKYIPEDEEK
ncbi:MAG: rhomboid family intramembrane serine protease [Chitinophagales bacterium]